MAEYICNRACLSMTDFECHNSILRKDAFAGDECGDGAVKGETVLAGGVGGVTDKGAGVFIVFDRGREGVVDVRWDVRRISSDDVKGGWGVETLE